MSAQPLGLAEAIQEREQAIGWLVAAGRGAGGGDPVDRFLLDRVVGVHVNLGRGGALVPEPERDREQVDLLGAQQHRIGVPQHVRGDPLAGKRWAGTRRGGDVLVPEPGDGLRGQRSSLPGRE